VRLDSVDSLGPITHIFLTRWHWRAFLTGGGSAFWLLAYGLFYWISRLSLDSFSSVVLYLGYLFLLVLLDFLVTGWSFPASLTQRLITFPVGTIGFLATYWAIRKLYNSIKID
jgi:transmembrane 9 superfamily member 2/4